MDLELGKPYGKKELASLLSETTLAKVREGLFHRKKSNETLLFVDLVKKGKADRFHFDDKFEDDLFHWDSQTTQHINTPKFQELITGKRVPHLFVRINQKLKGKTQPFVYAGELRSQELKKTLGANFLGFLMTKIASLLSLLQVYSNHNRPFLESLAHKLS